MDIDTSVPGAIYVRRNECCGGVDGLEVIAADTVRVWVSGMCGGNVAYPDGGGWVLLDQSSALLVTEDVTISQVQYEMREMGDEYFYLRQGRWFKRTDPGYKWLP